MFVWSRVQFEMFMSRMLSFEKVMVGWRGNREPLNPCHVKAYPVR